MKSNFIVFILVTGLVITACGAQPTETSVSQTTDTPVSPTQTIPTDTAVPTEAPTDAPATDPSASAATVSFANDILPILESRCLNCHGGDREEEGLIVKTYSDLMSGSDNGPVLVAGDADNSLIVELILANKMPKRGPKLTPPQVQLIIDWINQGALNN